MWSQIVFHKTAKEGSNAGFWWENMTIEVELYPISLEHGENGVFLKNALWFVTITDCIPVLRFNKKIEAFLTNKNLLPTYSTCGLILHLPQDVTKKKDMLETALKEELRFGIIWRGLCIDITFKTPSSCQLSNKLDFFVCSSFYFCFSLSPPRRLK